MKATNNKGFTLVEILIVCGVTAVFLTTAISVFSNFRRGYSRSESSAIHLQDTALFVAKLRNDLNNAVIDPSPSSQNQSNHFETTDETLSFMVYDNTIGQVTPVSYSLSGKQDQKTLKRRLGNNSNKILIKNNVASLSWNPEIESFSGKASGTFRLCLNLKILLKDKKSKEKPFAFNTRIFPARLNKQLNNR
ncbi:MAG: PulJ/GspJ family protein [Candidatus Rifleibacteriota bacterium]